MMRVMNRTMEMAVYNDDDVGLEKPEYEMINNVNR